MTTRLNPAATLGTLLLAVAPTTTARQPPAAAPAGALPAGAVVKLGVEQFQPATHPSRFALSADGRLAAVHAERQVVFRAFPSGVRAGEIELDRWFSVGEFALAPDGSAVAFTEGGGLKIVERATGGTQSSLLKGLSQGVAFSADGRRVVVGFESPGSRPSQVVVWDRTEGKEVAAVVPVHHRIARGALSADGITLATYGVLVPSPPTGPVENVIQLWDVATGAERVRAKARYAVGTAAVSPDGRTVAATVVQAPDLELLDATTGQQLRVIRTAPNVPLFRSTFSADGKRVAVAGADGSATVWDVGTGENVSATPAPPGTPANAAPGFVLTGPEKGVAWNVRGQVVVAWEFPSGKLLTPPPAHARSITSIAYSADGKTIFSGDAGGVLVEWDPTRPAEPKVTAYPNAGPLVIAPGGRHVAVFSGMESNSGRETDHVFDRATGKLVFSRARRSRLGGGITAVFSPTGDRVLFPNGIQYRYIGEDPADVWETATGKSVGRVDVPTTMSAASFSPDGARLVVASAANPGDDMGSPTVTGWDTKTWKKAGEVTLSQRGGAAALVATNSGSAVMARRGIVALDLPGGRVGETIDGDVRWPGQSVSYGPLAFNSDGTRLAAGVPTATPGVYAVRLYDWPQAHPLHTFPGLTGRVTALAFSPDGKRLTSGSEDTTLIVWDVAGK